VQRGIEKKLSLEGGMGKQGYLDDFEEFAFADALPILQLFNHFSIKHL
jgi:hypothetical protein